MKNSSPTTLSISLKIRLSTIFVAVTLFSGFVIWVGIDVTNKVTRNTERLINNHIPELRAISDLQQSINQHHISLYADYAEATEIDHEQHEKFRSDLEQSLLELRGLGLTEKEIAIVEESMTS